MKAKNQVLEVWGEFACFTRPELKVERFSYPVVTPSAARAIFDAIYCKPNKNPAKAEFRWQVSKVEILAEPKYIALRRNETKDKAPSERTILGWASGKNEPEPLFADGTKDLLGTDQKGRTQRQTMALKDVHYRLHAEIRPWPGYEDRIQGMEAQFRRRAANGKCIYQPYFGCREFPAFFTLVEPNSTVFPKPVPLDMDIGLMLYDVFDLSKPGCNTDEPAISLFHATVENGVMTIPEYENDGEVLKAIGGKS
ncbi:MAG: type I-C CRISPR-associated protein Cas5c [Actinomycetota bacterium]|nr:type I-C CRISPR-associated protein Cas5c [Actinomycetota bacterium]